MREFTGHTVKDRIEKAFLDLMDEKPYPDITVTDIINRAEVARVSYYRNYSSITDIVDSITDSMAKDFVTEMIPLLNGTDERRMREFLFNYFYQLSRNSKKLLPTQKVNREVIRTSLHRKISNIQQENHTNTLEEKYRHVAMMGMLDGIAETWLSDGMKESPEEMINYSVKLMMKF